jgi:quercetin dioxygenase-like cupin family protein
MTDPHRVPSVHRIPSGTGRPAASSLPIGQLAVELCARLGELDEGARQREAQRILGLVAAVAGPEPLAGGGTARPPAELDKTRWAADTGSGPGVQHLDVAVVPGVCRVVGTASATGRALLSNGYLGADLLHIPRGDSFPPHTHPGDHLLFVLGGRGVITIGGQIVPTFPGEAFMVEGAVPHAVGAIDDHVLLSVGAPHRPVDSPARQATTTFGALLDTEGSITCQVCGLAATDRDGLAARGCRHSGSA